MELVLEKFMIHFHNIYGENTDTFVEENGRNLGRKELLTVGMSAGLEKERRIAIIEMIEMTVSEMLGEYLL